MKEHVKLHQNNDWKYPVDRKTLVMSTYKSDEINPTNSVLYKINLTSNRKNIVWYLKSILHVYIHYICIDYKNVLYSDIMRITYQFWFDR